MFTSRPMEEGELQQPVVEKQPQPVPALKHVEAKKLQRLVSNREEFLQELFEERPISSIIPQHPRSKTRTMMKQKGKALIKE
jgi:hypothetical protein